MAEEQDDHDKSEDPTQKRLDDALERGDVAKSQEVSTWFIVAGGTLVLITFSGGMGSSLQATLAGLIANSYRVRADGYGLTLLATQISKEVLAALAIPLLLLALAALVGNIIQHRLVWSTESLKPKFSKISPIAGLGRLFSKQAIANFVKGLLKLGIIGAAITLVLWPERDRLEGMVRTDPAALFALSKSLSLQMLGAVVALLALIAGADFLFQYRQWYQKQKMSMREMKEEFKQTEGDPAIKARIRRIRETKMRSRMMAAVPSATVIITNPTHFAVALKYERGDSAPVCVAKGMDAIALKMREVAKDHNVPIVENPPLARTLHATVQIDQEIPPEHYKAVAEVIGYVMRLRQGVSRH